MQHKNKAVLDIIIALPYFPTFQNMRRKEVLFDSAYHVEVFVVCRNVEKMRRKNTKLSALPPANCATSNKSICACPVLLTLI